MNLSNFVNGKHIIAARTMAGLSQADLALLTGLHRNSVQYWESNARIRCGAALRRIEEALALKGVTVKRSPPSITLDCAL